ncbi:MAG TPA: peptidoglycan-associated lipoprotein Pal [Allosphingosinicella sp.]|nr:peptidoglycan-associated lipoprotein Pal [Allosphingosinicella sp.]
MKRVTSLVAIAVALTLTSGCARRNRELPPEPPSDSTPADTSENADGDIAGAAVPGSRADFLQTVGQYGDRILFDFDSFEIDAEDRGVLDTQAQWLTRYPAVRVTIEGHADERGTREYNLALGDRRANAARAYLESRGISATRMQVISWGKERPAVPESNEAAWAQNRRAVTVVPQ